MEVLKVNPIKKPFKSYKGDGKFAYACYSLEDMDFVFPFLLKLNDNRYRIRYDEGVQDEVEVDALRKHNIKNCEVLLVFMSQKALSSIYFMKQLEMAQKLEITPYIIYLDHETTFAQGAQLFGEDVKGIRVDESDEETLMEVIEQLLVDCQEPEKVEERVYTYDELLDEVYPDQVNASKDTFVAATTQDSEKIKKSAAASASSAKIAKKEKRSQTGKSLFNAILVVGVLIGIAVLLYLFFGDQINEVLHPEEVVNYAPFTSAVKTAFISLIR